MASRPTIQILLASIVGVFGCAGQDDLNVKTDGITKVKSTTIEKKSVDGDWEFALKFLRAASPPDKTFVYSPVSVSSAFSILYSGSRGKTSAEIARVFEFAPDLAAHLANLKYSEMTGPGLALSNAVFSSNGYEVKQKFVDDVVGPHKGLFERFDYPKLAAEKAAAWCEEVTRGRIKNILTEAELQEHGFAIASLAYFDSAWQAEFPRENTQQLPFFGTEGVAKVEMMRSNNTRFLACVKDKYVALEIPFKDEIFSALILLPSKQFSLKDMESTIDSSDLASLRTSVELHDGVYSIPRFSAKTKFKIQPPLSKMGLVLPFAHGADFSGIANGLGRVTNAYHVANIDVSESGTKAAAATVILFRETDPPHLEFHANRPFLFVIRHNATNTPVFLARVASLP